MTPMAFPFRALETYDLPDLVRLAAPRPALAGGPATTRRRSSRGCCEELGVTPGATVREVADRVFACEQPDGPRLIRQVVIGGDDAALVVDTGLPGSPADGILPVLERLGAAADRAAHAPRRRPRRPAPRRCSPRTRPRARWAAPADLPLMGDPARAIRERYARFAASTTCPSRDEMQRRALEPVRRSRSDRPRRRPTARRSTSAAAA